MATRDPIVDLTSKWGVVLADIIKNHPGMLDGINPMQNKEKAKKGMFGKSKQDQLNQVIAAQFAVIEANANLQALIEVYKEQNHQ
jgi:hypothetical protein